MAYVFQTFVTSQVLTSTQMNQVEVNVRDHVHGYSGVTANFTTLTGSALVVDVASIETLTAGATQVSTINVKNSLTHYSVPALKATIGGSGFLFSAQINSAALIVQPNTLYALGGLNFNVSSGDKLISIHSNLVVNANTAPNTLTVALYDYNCIFNTGSGNASLETYPLNNEDSFILYKSPYNNYFRKQFSLQAKATGVCSVYIGASVSFTNTTQLESHEIYATLIGVMN